MVLSENPDCNPACRACHYKDLEYTEQLTRKQAWAERCLAPWRDRLHPIREAPEAERLGYRAKSWLRTEARDGTLAFGMIRARQGETKWEKEFIAWDTCPLHHPAIRETLARLGPALADESLFGVWIGVPHLVIVAKDDRSAVLRALDWKSILAPPLTEVSFHRTNQVGKSVFGEGPFVPLFGTHAKTDRPVRAFRQIAQSLLTEARGRAVRSLLESRPSAVLDLYCGAGDLSLLLPLETGWIGVESAKDAVAYANGLRDPSQAPHFAFLGLLEDRLLDPNLLARIPSGYSLHLNPPRPGLGKEGAQLLADFIGKRPPTSIAYLSCSASSLARDLIVLERAGYAVKSLRPYDFFPQTEHFETLAELEGRT